MARRLTTLLPALGALGALCAPALAPAACEFDQSTFEITNPFAASCGGNLLTYTADDSSSGNIALGYPPPVPVDSLTAVDGFRTYESLHAQHQLLATDHDEVAAVVVGQTLAGRDIWAYAIGDTDTVTVDGLREPAVLITGGIHAREWQSPEALTEIFEQLVETNDDAGLGNYLADNLNAVLIPVLNVDGFIQTQRYPLQVSADPEQPREGRMRRKNLRDPANTNVPIDDSLGTVDDNFYGVDLNRNNEHGFGNNDPFSSTTLATSLVNRGPRFASEPEIMALQAAADLAGGDRLRLYVDAHSFTQIYFTPTTGNTRRDANTSTLRTRMRAVTAFKYGFTDDPVTSRIGTTADYFAEEYQIPSWTLEIEPDGRGGAQYGGTDHGHSGFILPDSEVARMRDEIAQTHLLGFYHQAGPPFLQAARIVETTTGETVYAAEWLAGMQRTMQTDTNQALVPGGSYTLWLAFSKPMRWRDEADAIADFPGQVTNVPTISLEAPGLGDSGEVITIDPDNGGWLNSPGGAPVGYLRYRDDALAVDFGLPADLQVGAPTPLVLSVSTRDLAQARLDANPSTPVDWADGAWTGYEDALGVAGDSGGIDCSFTPFAAPADEAQAAAPDAPVLCTAATPTAPPPPTPAPPPAAPRSGGGGAISLAFMFAVGYLVRRRPGITRS